MQNDFDNEPEARAFYEALGFDIEAFPYYDGSYTLSTLAIVPDAVKDHLLQILSITNAWILKPAK